VKPHTLVGLLGAALVSAASTAAAVTPSVTIESTDSVFEDATSREASLSLTVGIEECRDLFDTNATITATWDFSTTPTGNYVVKYQRGSETCEFDELVSSESCPTDPENTFSSTNRSISGSRAWSELNADGEGSGFSAEDCLDAGAGAPSYTFALVYEETVSGSKTVSDSRAVLKLDLARPTSPVGVDASAGETSIGVSWDEVAGAAGYEVWYADGPFVADVEHPEDRPEGVRAKEVDGGSVTSTTVSDLDTGATYYVAVLSVSDVGNRSLPSGEVSAETSPTADFFEAYKAAGGVEEGGFCAAASPAAAGGASLVWLVALALVRRRPRHA
jgi:hypothetical protein